MTDPSVDVAGDGPHVAFKPKWVFELGARDSVLVLKALGGREMSQDESERARELCDRLTMQRAAQCRDTLRALENAEDGAMRNAGFPDGSPDRMTPRRAR